MPNINLKIKIDGKEANATLQLTDDNIKELYQSFKYGKQQVNGFITSISQVVICFSQRDTFGTNCYLIFLKTAVAEGWNYNPGKAAFFPKLNKYPPKLATNFVANGLNQLDFNLFYDGKIKGNYPVAVIDEKYQKLIGAKTNNVVLSDESLSKNKREHKDLSIKDYYKIPTIISKAQLVVRDKENVLVFIKQNGRIYHTVIKTTQKRDELYLTSFRITSEEDVIRMKKKGKVLKDEL